MPETRTPDNQLPDVLYALDAELNRAIDADQQRVRGEGPTDAPTDAKPRSRGTRSRRGLVLAIGLATVALLCAAATLTLGGQSVETPLSTQAALAEVASAAVTNPLPFAAEDQYLYTHSRGMYMNTYSGGSESSGGTNSSSFTALVTRDRKAWVSVERFGMFEEKNEGVDWVTQRDRRKAQARDRRSLFDRPDDNVMGLAPNGKYFVGSESLTRAELLEYPTEPAVIYRRIRDGLGGAGQGPADGVWQSLTESLYEYSFPAELRAGMVQALGLIPGVKSLGIQRDPLGREGHAFAREHDGVNEQIMFDLTTSSVLYTHGELTKRSKALPDWPVGTTIESYLQFEQKVVDEPPARLVRRLKR